jgi:uncharacterized membrane protein YphA (DoxX/SURF4 family)
MSSVFATFKRHSRGVTALLVTLLFSQRASAHEKWFQDGPVQPTCWCTLGSWRPLLAMGSMAILTLLGWSAWQWRKRRNLIPGPQYFGATPEGRAKFFGLVPALLGVHLAVPLMTMGILGTFFSPNNHLSGSWRFLLGLGQIGCALAFFYGAFTRAAAVALALLWLVGVPVFGWEAMCENLQYLGFAAFFYCNGRGPFAVDRLLFPRFEPSKTQMIWAMPCLRIAVGLSLAFVAFTEKLANPALAASFLTQHAVNFTPYIHLPMCDATFALVCGAIELLVGIWIALGIFPRTIILIAFIPFNLTLTIFHWFELVGHLPFYGALAALLVWSVEHEDRRLWVMGNAARPGTLAEGSAAIEAEDNRVAGATIGG